MHSRYCHGEGELEHFVQRALEKNMYAIGFSSHAPVPFNTDWHMRIEQLDSYISEIECLKKKYKEIQIYSGLEVDYIPGIISPNTYSDRTIDFTIGSIHYVGQLKNQVHCCFDDTPEEFERTLELVFDNDIRKLVTKYYELIIEMVLNSPPDIIGHLDLIKKLNSKNRYFSEEENWYQEIIADVIKVISTSNCIVEINTRGYYKAYTKAFYPGKQILEKCFEADIPVTISSDAHHPNEIVNNFEDVASLLSEIGSSSFHIFDNGKWSPVLIGENGSGLEI